MALAGTASSYDLTVGVKVNMDEAIYTLDPTDIPLLGGIGSDGYPILGSMPVDEIQFFWMTEQLLVPRADATALATTTQTSITLAANDKYRFATGDVVRVARASATTTELMQVTGYSATTSTDILVTRAFASTTASTINTSDSLVGVGAALAEGSDPSASRMKDRVTATNYTQIFGPYKISMTGTEQVVSKYGVPNEWDRQLRNRMAESAVAREMAYIYGKAFNDTTNKQRLTGGITTFITTNVDSTSTQLTVANIQTNLQNCYNNGGIPDVLAANPKALTDLNDLSNTSIVRVEIDDSRRGRMPVATVMTEFGELVILRHRWLYKQHAVCWRRDQAVRRTLRPMQFERLAKTGDADHAQFLCEEGLEFKGQQHAFFMNSLTAY